MRYIKGEANWMADALSRLGQKVDENETMDSLVKQCLDFFFKSTGERKVEEQNEKVEVEEEREMEVCNWVEDKMFRIDDGGFGERTRNLGELNQESRESLLGLLWKFYSCG